MEGGAGCADFPDLKELESKVGQKPPDGLLRWLREDPAAHFLPSSPSRGLRQGLGEKIKALKLELVSPGSQPCPVLSSPPHVHAPTFFLGFAPGVKGKPKPTPLLGLRHTFLAALLVYEVPF